MEERDDDSISRWVNIQQRNKNKDGKKEERMKKE